MGATSKSIHIQPLSPRYEESHAEFIMRNPSLRLVWISPRQVGLYFIKALYGEYLYQTDIFYQLYLHVYVVPGDFLFIFTMINICSFAGNIFLIHHIAGVKNLENQCLDRISTGTRVYKGSEKDFLTN